MAHLPPQSLVDLLEPVLAFFQEVVVVVPATRPTWLVLLEDKVVRLEQADKSELIHTE
eukprot:COSAG02_NODE_6589_length_3475_cov_1.318720_1_plen_58_part_00